MTAEAKAALGARDEDDGVFFMNAEDFSAHWEEVRLHACMGAGMNTHAHTHRHACMHTCT